MVFSSNLFLFYFLPLALLIYYVAHLALPQRGKHFLLALASYVFYGWANPLFCVLMFATTLTNYLSGLWMTGQFQKGAWTEPLPLLERGGPRGRSQKLALLVAVLGSLLPLAFFKYFNFGLDSWNALMHAMGADAAVYENFLRITLPLGISFYSFQALSYSIDVFRGDARAVRSLTDFGCYVSMFPQLVAGPIVRYQDVADQIERRTHTFEKFSRGVLFVALGLTKKILLADPCGKVADTCFGAGALKALEAWYGAVAYSFQIYFDFSAYSDMAIGLGLMMGFMFAKNFNSPYLSQSITEFWQRWHLSLSHWLRDNLYFPLGGNRKGPGRTYVNLMMVMLLGGLWHGASWNFVIWGGIHGGMLAVERLQGKDSFYRRLPAGLRIAATFLLVCIAWVFFRAPDLPAATRYCGALIGLGSSSAGASLVGGQVWTLYHGLTVLVAGCVVWGGVQTWDFTKRVSWVRAVSILALFALALVMLAATRFHPFIYFIF
ncbi:MAG: MBOAT family protein [Lentisphaerales bacterium]|jgi:alginate O-acetyltransferase complex protein AlgI|nr:MAG: MBOAT family protein [Lentisphaerales bacterium]